MQLDVAQTEYHRVRITRAAESFRARQFAVHCFEKGSEAVDFFFSSLSPGESIGHGGSDTTRQLGVMDRLRRGDYNLLDRSRFGHSYDEQLDIRRQTLSADVFVASSNAVSIGGALVNIDGDGNRISAIGFGPRRVFLFIGRNKLCEDLDSAIYRARNVASPALAIRLGKRTPCVTTGRCHDCASPERICSNLSIIERCNPAQRITMLFINEDLGL
ncbi:lactate utilization protein [Candidatus Bipolaricaulota bacterium]|nr:lactate utilization protein [Candidatus Bipolaricaulota bacterium]